MASFDGATALEDLGGSRFGCTIDGEWLLPNGSPHGGYVGGLILRAILAAAGEEGRTARSVTVHYLRPPQIGSAEIEVETIKHGRSMTFVLGRLLQGGKLQAQATAVLGTPRTGPEIPPPPMPDVPSADKTPVPPEYEAARPDFTRHFEMRPTFALPFSGAERAEVGGWTRTVSDLAIDEPLIFAIMDLWYPAPWAMTDHLVPAPTVDLTVHFTADLAPVPDDRWLLVRMTTPQVTGGLFCEDAELWTPDGRLVAQSRQLALALG